MRQNPTRSGRVVDRRARETETSQKTQKWLKSELQWHTSRRECERAEQRLAWRREQEPPNRELKDFKFKTLPTLVALNKELLFVQQHRNKRQHYLHNGCWVDSELPSILLFLPNTLKANLTDLPIVMIRKEGAGNIRFKNIFFVEHIVDCVLFYCKRCHASVIFLPPHNKLDY